MRQNRTASHNQKRRKWPVILGVLAVVILIAFAALRQRQPAASANGIRTARAETGSLSITVVGTGNLEYDDAEDIKIPTGIVVDEVPVESGDVVKAGDVLATFDPLSLRQEIESVRSTIDGLDRKIQNTKDKNETETVKAYVEGRVKRIYAEKGDSALDVYYEHGALMVLSIDGKMAVDFTVSAPLSIGEKVTVLLENGKTAEGTVEKAENGNITVTMTDNGPRLDETVTVQSKNGETLGSGKLYVRSPIRIVATDGRVKTVHVSENDKVSAGKTLVTLEDLSTSADYEKLLADRAEQMEKLDLLLKLSKTNALVAESGGVIQSVLIKEGETVGGTAYASSSASGGTASGGTASSAPAYGGSAAGAITAGGSFATGGIPSAASAAAASPSPSASQPERESTVVAFTASPANSVLLAVEVDELDILSIQNGMQAQITFDAIPGRTFTGEIFKIADAAAATGGVAKFTVKMRLAKDDAMRIGMNATANILVERKENILLLPIAALQESGGRVYVYTKLDEKTGKLTGEVDVTTGSSDGAYAEITSGLSEGAEVYYKSASGENFMQEFGPGRFFRNNSGSEDQE